jgi:hypothetical protein
MEPAEESIRRGILRYLARHPQAQDTIEGIVEWWLLEQRIVDANTEIEKVLEKLVAENLVIRRQARDGKVYYCAKPN